MSVYVSMYVYIKDEPLQLHNSPGAQAGTA